VKRYDGHFGKVLLPVLALLLINNPVGAAPLELSLDESVVLALKNNPAMQIADAGKEKSRWAIRQAQAGQGVNLSFQHTDSRYDSPPETTGLPVYIYYTKFDNQVTLNLPVYSGDKLEKQTEEAKLSFAAADANLKATSQQVKLSAMAAYYGALESRELVTVNREAVKELTVYLQDVERQFETGMVAKSDVLYSQVQLAITQDSLVRAQTNYENAIAALYNVIGLPQDSEIKLTNHFTYSKETISLESCIEQALANRPEMAQAKANLSIAQDDIQIAQSGNLPKVNLSATQDWYDQDLPGTKNPNWQVGLSASFSIFDSGLTESQIQQAKYNLATVKGQSKQAEDSITLEVKQDYHSTTDAEKRIEMGKLAVEKAEEDFKISEIGYSAGMNTNSGVIDAETALTQAKTNYIQALYDYNNNRAQLDKAMGVPVF